MHIGIVGQALLGAALASAGPNGAALALEPAGNDARARPAPQPLEAFLPADASAVLVVKDLAALCRQLDATSWGGLFRPQADDDEQAKPGEGPDPLARRWAAAREALVDEVGISIGELAAVARGPVAVAILSPDAAPPAKPTWVVLADVGADTVPARRLIDALGTVRAGRPGVTTRPVERRGAAAVLFGPADSPAGAAVTGRHLIISSNAAGLDRALASVQDAPKAGLFAAEAFRSLRGHLNADAAEAYGYVNPGRLRLTVWPAGPPAERAPSDAREAASASGDAGSSLFSLLGAAALDSVGAVGFAVDLDPAGARDLVVLATVGDRAILTRWLAGARAEDLLTTVPRYADFVLAVRGDAAGFWDGLHVAMRRSMDPRAYGRVHTMLARLTQAVGFDLRGDLLAALGADWVVMGLPPMAAAPGPPRASSAPAEVQCALMVPIQDRAALMACLAAFRQFVERKDGSTDPAGEEPPVALKQFKLGEQVVDYLLLKNTPALSPSIAVTSDRLIVTTTTTAMRRILAGLGRKEDSVAADPAFQALLKQVDGDAPAVGLVTITALARLLAGGAAGSSAEAAAPAAAVAPSAAPGAGVAGSSSPAFVFSVRPAAPGLIVRARGPVSLTAAATIALVDRLLAPGGPASPAPRTHPEAQP